MKKPVNSNDIFLQPGEFYFGERNTRIRTILGSCVSIVMWHEKRLIGGMCHYILPKRTMPSRNDPDGRYADEAIELFMRKIHAANTDPGEYQVKIFGGGNMFPEHKGRGKRPDVPSQNVIAARELVRRHDLNLVGENLGGAGHRQVIFDIWNGHVWMRRTELENTDLTNTTP